MIKIDLACSQNHPFEGWFKSHESYESQLKDGLVSCPYCGSSDLHIKTEQGNRAPQPEEVEISLQADMLGIFQQLMTIILASSEDVGSNFAHEARKIHHLEAQQRAIRGDASLEDYESLREEGIDVLLIPTIRKEDFN